MSKVLQTIDDPFTEYNNLFSVGNKYIRLDPAQPTSTISIYTFVAHLTYTGVPAVNRNHETYQYNNRNATPSAHRQLLRGSR